MERVKIETYVVVYVGIINIGFESVVGRGSGVFSWFLYSSGKKC